MFCLKCQNDLADCTCPDIDERMAAIGEHEHFSYRMCAKCNKHCDRCECDIPDLKMSEPSVWKKMWDRFIGNN